MGRLATAGTTAVVVAVALAGTAMAHVKVSGVDAVQGGSGVVTFRVPSESQTASTTELLITFPADTPFTSADIQPKAGWTGKVVMKPLSGPTTSSSGRQLTEYVAQVDFKADDAQAAIPPGQFDMFNISVGPFPKQSSVSFGALQTYSDGTQVNWDEKSANGAEPAHPAPVLQLAQSSGAGSSSVAETRTSVAVAGGSPAWPGIVGMVAGLVALVVAAASFVVTRRASAAAAQT
jgi:uncharacterized protein